MAHSCPFFPQATAAGTVSGTHSLPPAELTRAAPPDPGLTALLRAQARETLRPVADPRDGIDAPIGHRSIMLAQQTILEAARRAAAAAECPLQVFVFGSDARGDADAGSDLDLLVVEREDATRRQSL